MTESEKSDIPFTKPDPALAVGTRHAGFTVTSVEPLPELSGTAYVLRHDASGARAMWLAVDDNDKSFSIAFKTPPADDTGVFHILEHSVLCGSDRFPVKEPFVNLLKTSMQTFLNALTFPDKTMYPVASTNTADLENLMDVYLDAVLHPAIYHRPRIFEQEGWHYELEGLDQPLTYNGVVLNEMKGALSDPDDVLYQAVGAQLFPDTPYGFESGGNPRDIPNLTYESFLDSHARHYNLANSYTILYGNLDIDRELAFVDERFRGATDRHAGAPNPLPEQRPVMPGLRRVEMATAPENASVGVAYVIGNARDRERVLATDVLLDTLAGSNEAPLKRVILDSGLGKDFTATLLDGTLQPYVLFQLRGAREGVADEFRGLLEDTCARLAREGIDRDKLDASLAQCEFNLRENDWGPYGDGVALSMQALSSWLYDDDRPVDYLRYQDAIDHMRQGLDDRYFEDLLDGLVCRSAHSAAVELVPVEEGSAAEEQARLAGAKARMTEDELQAVMDEEEALRREQEAPDSPEALATLPRLTVDDIEDAPRDEPLQRPDAPLPCLYHDMETHGIVYAYHYFDLGRLSYEDLPYVGVLTDLLGKLGTRDHDASELDTLIEGNLGELGFFCETYGRDDDLGFADPKLVVVASALSERVGALASIPREVWSTTDFSDTDRILAILRQRRITLAQHFVSSGHSAAMAALSGCYSKVSLVSNQMGGVEYYLFLKDLLAHWDERKDALVARLADLCRRVFVADGTYVSVTGAREDLDRLWEAGGDLGLGHAPAPDAGDASAGREGRAAMVVPEPRPRNLYHVIPSNVCYVAEGTAPSPLDAGDVGTWQVAARMLSFDYLWNEVRVKGGAYGVGFRRTVNGLQQYWSFRDPGITGTLDRYAGAARWLADWSDDGDEMDGYVVSVVASHDAPAKPRAIARRQDAEFFSARPADWRDRVREQELAVTADKVRALAPSMEGLAGRGTVCVFGPRDMLDDPSLAGLDFEVVELMDDADAADAEG